MEHDAEGRGAGADPARSQARRAGRAIVITPGGELKAEFKDALTEFRARMRGSDKAKESKVESLTADEGYPVLDVAEEIQDDHGRKVKQYRVVFFALQSGYPGRIHLPDGEQSGSV